MEILIARKTVKNAQAFVKVVNNQATVFGRFGSSGFVGPVADISVLVPEELRTEIAVVGSWKKERSAELTEFCDDCFRQAAENDSWFKMFVE